MVETKKEFLKRKKSEKRLQAERQVREAYAKCEDFYSEDEHGQKYWYRGLQQDGKLITWRIQMEPEIEDLYSTIDISKALDMPRERLRDWLVRGFIHPSLPSTSKGTIAIFTKRDVICVALFAKLIDRGFKREAAAEYIKLVSSHNVFDFTSLISFKHSMKGGKADSDIHLMIGDGVLELKIDSSKGIMKGPFAPTKGEDWDDIHIINKVNLEKEVEIALEKLEPGQK